MLLDGIKSPKDLKGLSKAELVQLAGEIREQLIELVSASGGHLGPNLGVVETTIALHRVFDSPKDSIIFDTGHQSYVHKMLTGRADLKNLREKGGIAGYPQRIESVHDIVENSHASTAISWADGISRAQSAKGEHDKHVVAVIGDGALTGGMAWEALNNISDDNDRSLVIVVNDNGRSYAPTIGGFAKHLNSIRTEKWYKRLHRFSRKAFFRLGLIGKLVFSAAEGAGKGWINTFAPKGLFPNLDIKYIGPIDGHDLSAMETALSQAKHYNAPVIVHAITQKGKGYDPAVSDEADQFHAVGQINPETGLPVKKSKGVSWTSVFRDEVADIAAENPNVVGITAAMKIPVGLDKFAERFPDRVFDVGIAEQHATTSAAGMAYGGLHPVVAIYSTFVNRAFDQLLMDVALHKAGVTFVLDRSGVTGPDGASHHGMWDLALLQVVPNIAIAAPRDAVSLREQLREAVTVEDGPTVIRFPKGNAVEEIPSLDRTQDGADVLARSASKDVLIVAVGAMVPLAMEVHKMLAAQGIGSTVIDPRWVIPVKQSIVDASREHRLVVTIEDGIRVGGIGTRMRQKMRAADIETGLQEIGLPDEFLEHASRDEILERVGLTPKAIARDITAQVLGAKVPKARPLEDSSEQISDKREYET
jgi:1-deoxy-D-xylulose-5-phosphate synthase